MTCEARRVNDQMICGACGLQWDHDDPDPPECSGPIHGTDVQSVAEADPAPEEWLREARRLLDDET